MKVIVLWIILIFVAFSSSYAKNDANEHIKKGNSLYNKQKFKDAEIEYRKALEFDPSSNIAKYNLGNAMYRQGQFDEAMKLYDIIDKNKFNKNALADSYHNLGNSYLQNKQYEQSIESYKKALLSNPKDKDTKYNLEYARKMLQQQLQSQNQKNNQNNREKQNEDKNQQKQQQDKQKDKQDKDKQNSDNQENNKDTNREKQQNQQQNEPKISKEDAERILQALMNKEKDLQKQMQKKNAVRGRLSKNW